MDYIFHSLTDIALRRLYKFILKRTIGKYLEKELLIEQLQVTSRDGVVRLNDISLKVDVINDEFFRGQPMLLDSVVISSLEVHMSYNTILTESCRFVIDNVEIVLRPYCNSYDDANDDDKGMMMLDKDKRIDTLSTTTNSSSNSSSGVGVGVDSASSSNDNTHSSSFGSEDGQKGLSFIAHWIEVIVSRLQVSNTMIVAKSVRM